MKNMWRIFIIALVIIGNDVFAADKNRISLSFELKATAYLREFTSDERKNISQQATQILAGYLTAKVPFLDFEADNGSSDYQLRLLLQPKDPKAGGTLQEVGLRFQLLKQGNILGQQYWPFRTADEIDKPIGTVDVFLENVKTKLESGDYTGLIQTVLSKASVSEAAKFRPDLPGWELKHSYQDLCIRENSVLTINARLKRESVILSENYKSKVEINPDPESDGFSGNYSFNILCRVLKDQQDYSYLQNVSAEQVKGEGVFILQFSRLESCNAVISPEESGL